jgi:signal transduction histidine kinase
VRVESPPAGGGVSTRALPIIGRVITGAIGGWGRLLSAGGIVILFLVEFATLQRPGMSGADVVATMATTIVIAAAWIATLHWCAPGRQTALSVALAAVLGGGAVALTLISPQGAAVIAAVVALAAAANRLRGRTAETYAVVLIAAYLAAVALRSGFEPVILLSYGLGLTFAFVASRSVFRLRQEQHRTQALLAELQSNREAQLTAAATNERSRIAREIHDVLAHTLAALTVQLEGARVMLETRKSDPQALQSVERAHRLAREGLEETRRAVSALRGEPVPGPDQLAQLLADFEHDSGTSARLTVEGTAEPLRPETALAVYRTAQEALTNVRKHAHAERVEVVLRYVPDATQLDIVNHGEPTGAQSDGGYGLTGMRERAELLGGTLEAGAVGDGFRVRLRLPR